MLYLIFYATLWPMLLGISGTSCFVAAWVAIFAKYTGASPRGVFWLRIACYLFAALQVVAGVYIFRHAMKALAMTIQAKPANDQAAPQGMILMPDGSSRFFWLSPESVKQAREAFERDQAAADEFQRQATAP